MTSTERFETFPLLLLKTDLATYVLWNPRTGSTVRHTYSHRYQGERVKGLSQTFVHDYPITNAGLTRDGRVLILKNYALSSFGGVGEKSTCLYNNISGFVKLPDDSLILFDTIKRPYRVQGEQASSLPIAPQKDVKDAINLTEYNGVLWWARPREPSLACFTDYLGNRITPPFEEFRILNRMNEPSGVMFLSVGREVYEWYPGQAASGQVQCKGLPLNVSGDKLDWLITVGGFEGRFLGYNRYAGVFSVSLDGGETEKVIVPANETLQGVVEGGLIASHDGRLTCLRTLQGDPIFYVKRVEAVVHSSPTRMLSMEDRQLTLFSHTAPLVGCKIVLSELVEERFDIIDVVAVPASERALVIGFCATLFSELLVRDLYTLVGKYV